MPIPVTRYPQTDVDVAALGRDMRFPCLVKPIDTFTIRFPQGAKNAVVSSPDELEGFYRRHPSLLGRTIVQQIIRGGDGAIFVCAAYLNAQSEALVVYTGRKIRQYPPDYGITSVGESVYLPELERLTVEFLRAVGYRGLIGAEYVQDRATGAMYLLELNARSSYYNRLPTDCGINLAYTAYRDLIGDRVTDRPRQRDGVRWLDVLHDLGSFYATRRHRRMTWREWLASVLPARSFAYFDARDLKPFVYSVGQMLSVLGHKAAADIRSRGRSRARSG